MALISESITLGSFSSDPTEMAAFPFSNSMALAPNLMAFVIKFASTCIMRS